MKKTRRKPRAKKAPTLPRLRLADALQRIEAVAELFVNSGRLVQGSLATITQLRADRDRWKTHAEALWRARIVPPPERPDPDEVDIDDYPLRITRKP